MTIYISTIGLISYSTAGLTEWLSANLSAMTSDALALNTVSSKKIESAIAGSCLTVPQVKDYAGWKSGMSYADLKDLYGWHISDLKIYDNPRELRPFTGLLNTRFGVRPVEAQRPPQSWCYVQEIEVADGKA